MLNPKNADNFYINTSAEFYEKSIGFNPDTILDKPADELDGIEVLVQMVKQNKIDPWNIDLADIADKYMLHLSESKSNNLRLSGRALFFLAVLLKLKSNVLVDIDPSQFEVREEDAPEFSEEDSAFSDDMDYQDYFPDNVIPLDEVIQRRTSVKQNRNRIVTLKDLIRQLEFYEKLDKTKSVEHSIEQAQKRRIRSYKNLSNQDIINLAQEEYIENSVKILQENLTKIFETEEKVELNTLTLLGLDKTTAYIALLFLSVRTDFELQQEEFYSDLYVVKGKPKEESDESMTA